MSLLKIDVIFENRRMHLQEHRVHEQNSIVSIENKQIIQLKDNHSLPPAVQKSSLCTYNNPTDREAGKTSE